MGLVQENDVQDLVIPSIQKKRFRINGDSSKILELNTSDANIITRLNQGYKDLLKLADEVSQLGTVPKGTTEEELDTLSSQLSTIDNKMREKIDYIFDSNVSEVCAGNASMYDPVDGKFRWEHIIEALGNLYEKSFTDEFARMKKNISKHTSKYTSKRKKA